MTIAVSNVSLGECEMTIAVSQVSLRSALCPLRRLACPWEVGGDHCGVNHVLGE